MWCEGQDGPAIVVSCLTGMPDRNGATLEGARYRSIRLWTDAALSIRESNLAPGYL